MIGSAIMAFAGILFGAGLGVSGMTNPRKVIDFLDVTGGHWDPSLIFVMLGAIAVNLPAYRLTRRIRKKPVFDTRFHLPESNALDPPLLIGSALFGIGWGLGGFCPGPAITSLARLDASVFVVVASMVAGGLIPDAVRKFRRT